jgi:sugar lactone lactonase YvrE
VNTKFLPKPAEEALPSHFGRLVRRALGLAGGLVATGAFAQVDYATPYAFTTLAGTPPIAGSDGAGAAAQFNGPSGVATDSNGNIYVADTGDDTIRMITPAGFTTTLAGRVGAAGSADGTGAAARFNAPFALAVDSSGNIYVSDSGNGTIREIIPTVVNGVTAWVVTTLAGTAGQSGSADGPGSVALFGEPGGIAVDGAGNLYVADSYYNTIRKVTPIPIGGVTNWVVTTLAGTPNTDFRFPYYWGGYADGTGAAALFAAPVGVAVDGNGNVYVADKDNCVIRKITPGGVVTTYAGSVQNPGAMDGTTATAGFLFPVGIALDGNGNIYVADTGGAFTVGMFTQQDDCTIRKITPAGIVSTLAGTPGVFGAGYVNGPGATAEFYFPNGVAVDTNGNVYVADSTNDVIRKVTPAGFVSTLAGGRGGAGSSDGAGSAAQFKMPFAVALDGSGNAYVADAGNDTIRKIAPGGYVTTLAGNPGVSGFANGTGAPAQSLFDDPRGVAADAEGNVYVADTGNDVIRKITQGGTVTTLAGTPGVMGSADGGGPSARFNSPRGVAVDGNGNIYVADYGNDTIRMITSGGIVSTLAGTPGVPGASDGIGAAALFFSPSGIAVDRSGNLYVGDSGNEVVRKIAPGGAVSTLAGTARDGDEQYIGYADGTGAAALFEYAYAVAVDAGGNVYVADSSLIRRITPGGVVTTLAGQPTFAGGCANGTGSGAQFSMASGIAVDQNGNVYVADTGNNAIRYGFPNLGFTIQPHSETLNQGSTVVFTAAASDATGYQWELNGNPLTDSPGGTTSNAISGSTGPELMITNATAASAGNYTCIATDSGGTNTSSTANLVVANAANPGSLPNFSGRAFVGTGDNVFIGGFYIVGSTSRSVLIQALGPALAAQGVAETLQHPALSIHDSTGAVIYSNTGWGSSSVLLNAAAAAYAQPVLQPNSADSEVLLTLPPGGYTAEISGADGGTGVALCAIYELP